MQDEELVRHLADSLGVGIGAARRVVDEVLAYYREPVEDYVRRRHAECRARGMRNERTFAVLEQELTDRLVAAPRLSQRQLRRMIYG